VTRSGEGEARWWFGALAEIRLSAEQTGGVLTIVEVTEPPNAVAPLHVHHHDDETFWILEGGVRIEAAGTVVDARPGDVVFGPRGVPHHYTVGDAGCRMLFILTPGGFERMVRDMSVPAGSRTPPPPPDEEPDWEQVAAVAAAHGCELLG
jgi:quercetin dioxygenase-like cupin family protein